MLIRNVRVVPLPQVPGAEPPRLAAEGLVDVRLDSYQVTEVGSDLAPEEQELDGEGGWLVPGLWDLHVHLGQWGMTLGRVDLTGTTSPEEALERTLLRLRETDDAVWGAGYRLISWDRAPSVAELDAISGDRPVILAAGDYHNAWLNTAALRLIGMEGDVTGVLEERDWFERSGELQALTTTAQSEEIAVREAVRRANALGVVGVRDLEFKPSFRSWPPRISEGLRSLRVIASCWPDSLDEALGRGLRTGQVLDDAGLVTMGPLKVVTDGSLGTCTALTTFDYGTPRGRGTRNYEPEVLTDLVRRATAGGLEVALHAIGDQAITEALDVLEAEGAHGSIEHVQLLGPDHARRMAQLGLIASMQPAHLLDDRDATLATWPEDHGRTFSLRTLLDAGVEIAMGSDAPVSPLDPWLEIAAAVHRSADGRGPWNPAQRITAGEALACSTHGAGTVGVGSRPDVVILGRDPLAYEGDSAAQRENLLGMPVRATFVAGRCVTA